MKSEYDKWKYFRKLQLPFIFARVMIVRHAL